MVQCNEMAPDVSLFSTESALAPGLIDKHKTGNKKRWMKTDNKGLEVLFLKRTYINLH